VHASVGTNHSSSATCCRTSITMTDSSVSGTVSASSLEVFCRSVALVGVAELFDKTWFMGLLLALRYRASTVFAGSVLALLLHTVLAVALGYAFAKLLSPFWLHILAATFFGFFAVLYAKDCYMDDPQGDAVEEGRKEAEADIDLGDGADSEASTTQKASLTEKKQPSECIVFSKSFMVVFIAEWGDRTQIAMIGQHASQPLIPVFLGSAVAFILLTFSAVAAATLLAGRKISSRFIHGISAICFLVFALLAMRDALVHNN